MQPEKRKREAIRPQKAFFKDKNHKKELSLFTLGGMSLETGLGGTKHRRVTKQICNPIEIYIRKQLKKLKCKYSKAYIRKQTSTGKSKNINI